MTDTSYPAVPTADGPCWPWPKSTGKDGYATLWTTASGKRGQLAHRVSYEAFRGPIPDGLVIDHLCRNRACVNPYHMEVVTKGENNRRGLKGFELTHLCRSGRHEILSEDDVYWNNSGRGCIHCRRDRSRRGHAAERRRKTTD